MVKYIQRKKEGEKKSEGKSKRRDTNYSRNDNVTDTVHMLADSSESNDVSVGGNGTIYFNSVFNKLDTQIMHRRLEPKRRHKLEMGKINFLKILKKIQKRGLIILVLCI